MTDPRPSWHAKRRAIAMSIVTDCDDGYRDTAFATVFDEHPWRSKRAKEAARKKLLNCETLDERYGDWLIAMAEFLNVDAFEARCREAGVSVED